MLIFLFRRRTAFMLVGTIALLFVARTTPESFGYGLPLVVIGGLIRVWSAGSLRKLECLVTSGPFALCRNPMYVGSFLITCGYLIMCRRLDVGIIGFVLFWLFHGSAIVREERMLKDKFGESYETYCKSVPRFVPCFNLSGAKGGFSLNLLSENLEWRSALSSLVVTALFGLIAYGMIPLELLGCQ